MVLNATDAGVKKASKNEPKASQHSPEKLRKLLEEAQRGKIPDGQGPSAGEQVAAAAGPRDDRQSAERELPNQPNSSQTFDISGDQHHEKGPADEP